MSWDANYIVYLSNFNIGWNTIDITPVAAAWYNPWGQNANYGFMMNSDPETVSAVNYIELNSANASSNRMKFTVKYSKLTTTDPPKINAYGNAVNSETGYVNLSWNALPDVSGYYVGIFNGQDYQLLNVGNTTSWSTKGKGIWPTASEIAAGRYKLHIDDNTHKVTSGGTELPCIPAFTYRNYSASGSYANNINYYFKVIPYNQYGYPADINASPAVHASIPDRTPPSAPTGVTVTPASWSNGNQHKLSWSGIKDFQGLSTVTDNWGTVEYSFDASNSWTNTGIKNGTYSNFTINTSGLADGDHTVNVRGKDSQGNYGTSKSAHIYIDRTGPSSPSLSVTPNKWTNQSSVKLSWSGITDLRGLANIEMQTDSGAWTPLNTSAGNYVNYNIDISGWTDGTHTITLRGEDKVGNKGQTNKITVYKDTTEPEGSGFSVNPNDWTNEEEITLSWEGIKDAHSGIAKIEYEIDENGDWIKTVSNVENGNENINITELEDGEHTIKLRLSDAAGNEKYLEEQTFKKDSTSPELEFVRPIEDDFALGEFEVWGNIEDIALEEWVLSAVDTTGEEKEIARDTNTSLGMLLGTAELDEYENGEILSFKLYAKDEAGNETEIYSPGNITVIKPGEGAEAVTADITIKTPAKGSVVTEPQADITYDKSYNEKTVKSIYYIDGEHTGETEEEKPFVFDGVAFPENSSHSIAVVSEDEHGSLHYSKGLIAFTSLKDDFKTDDKIESLTGIVHHPNGFTVDSDKGTVISKTATVKKNILALRFNASETKPDGTDILYYYSIDNGETWNDISPGKDVYLKDKANSVQLKAELFADGSKKPLLINWQLDCIFEQNPHIATTKLKGDIGKLNIKTDAATTPNENIVYTGLDNPSIEMLYVGGKVHSSELVFDTLAFEERTSHNAVIIAEDEKGKLYGSSQPDNFVLLRETVNSSGAKSREAAGTTTREIKSNKPIYSLHLETSQTRNVKYYASTDEGETWTELFPGKNAFLPEAAFTLTVKAEPEPGSALKAWHIEGITAGIKKVRVETVQSPEDLSVISFDGINSFTWSASPTEDAVYNVYKEGELFASELQTTQIIDFYPKSVTTYGVCAQVTFPEPENYDESKHLLTRTSETVYSDPVTLVPYTPPKRDKTYDVLKEQEQSLYVNALYGGNYIFSNDPTPPESSQRIDEKLLGSNKYCALGFEPININTGNFYMVQNDLSWNGNFDITRSYNSLSNLENGPFGAKWESGLSQHLRLYRNGTIAYVRPDGSTIYFDKQPDGSYKGNDDDYLKFEKTDGETPGFTVTEKDGSSVVFDTTGLLKYIDDGKGNVTEITRDDNGVITGAVSPFGDKLTIITDDKGHITEIQAPGERVLKYEYDGNNNLIGFTDAMGNTVKYVYDSLGQMTEWYDANGNLQAKNTYDEEGRVIRQNDANGGEYILEYFPTYTKATDADGNITETHFDEQGRTTKFVDANGGEQILEYGSDGNISRMTDESGAVSIYEYDKNGNKIKEIMPNGCTVEMTYDTQNNLTSLTDQNGDKTKYVYDDNNNLIKQINPDGTELKYKYNERGQLISETDENGALVIYEYEGANIIKQTGKTGGKTYFEYDAAGNLVLQTDANGNKTGFEYDAVSRLTKILFSDGTTAVYAYDAAGNIISLTDPKGEITRYDYDKAGNLINITYPDSTQETYGYDFAGNIVSKIDALGNTVRYEYDGNGNLIKETDALGNITLHEYDASDREVKETLPNGTEIQYIYDVLTGLLSQTIAPDGSTVSYEYDNNGNLTKETMSGDRIISAEYDCMNRIVKETDSKGYETFYQYDKIGQVISVTDAESAVTKYTYDLNGNTVRITDALGEAVTYEYGLTDNLISEKDALGSELKYEYNSVGQIIKTIDAFGNEETYEYDVNSNLVSITDTLSNTIGFSYDNMGRLTSTKERNGGISYNEYDATGRLIKETDALGNETKYEYDAKGQVVKAVDALGAAVTLEYDKSGNIVKVTGSDKSDTLYEYDNMERITAITEENGLKTEYEYDEAGNPVKETINGNSSTYIYDKNGNIASFTDAESNTVRFSYDKMNRLVKTLYPDSTSESYQYDLLGRLTKETPRSGVSTYYEYNSAGRITSVSTGSRITRYTYDAVGNLICVTYPDGSESIAEYDGLGNIISEADALGNVTSYEYNSMSLLTKTIYPDGAEEKTEYDLNGNMIKFTDPMNAATEYSYDALGRLANVKDALGNITEYSYDASDNLTRIKDANGNTTRYDYDTNGNVISETDALGNTVNYEYSEEGWLTKVIKADGKEIKYDYDNTGQLIKEDIGEKASVTYAYNSIGAVVEMEDDSGVAQYQYDTKGRLIKVDTSSDDTIKYSYDNYDRRSTIIYPNGNEVNYSYDLNNALIRVSGTENTEYEYDEAGRRIKTITGNNTTSYEYDNTGNLIRQVTSGDTELKIEYSYDMNGRITEEVRNEDETIYTSRYEYDDLGRLISFDYTGSGDEAHEEYSYDSVGNMLKKTVNGVEIQMTYTVLNQLESMNGANGSINYTYDPNGNLTEKSYGNYKVKYEYDTNDRLIKYIGYDSYEETYSYDGMGMMSAKETHGSSNGITLEELLLLPNAPSVQIEADYITGKTEYVYDVTSAYQNVLLETVDGRATIYEYGLERIAAISENSVVDFIYDGRGSVAQIISENKISNKRYTPFGEQLTPEISGYGFNAEYYTKETGTINLKNRQYEPALMKFSQKDILSGTVTSPQSLNRYTFTDNDPVNFTDPDGRKKATASFKSLVSNVAATVKKTISKPAPKKYIPPVYTSIQSAAKKALSTPSKQTSAISKFVSSYTSTASYASTVSSKAKSAKTMTTSVKTSIKSQITSTSQQLTGKISDKALSIISDAQAKINALDKKNKLTCFEVNKIILQACAKTTGLDHLTTASTDSTMTLGGTTVMMKSGNEFASIENTITKSRVSKKNGDTTNDFWKAGTGHSINVVGNIPGLEVNADSEGENTHIVETSSSYIGIENLKIEVFASSNASAGIKFGWTNEEGTTNYVGASIGLQNTSVFYGNSIIEKNGTITDVKDTASISTPIIATAILTGLTFGSTTPVLVGAIGASSTMTAASTLALA